MTALDYNYDPTGKSPDNHVSNEMHTASTTVGIFPKHGTFFLNSLKVEASRDGKAYGELSRGSGFTVSPIFKQQSAAVNTQVCSWIVLSENYPYVRISYQTLGRYVDNDLLDLLNATAFNRNDPLAWSTLKIQTTEYEANGGQYEATDQIRAMSEGASVIAEQIGKLAQPANSVTAAQLETVQFKMDEFNRMLNDNTEGTEELITSVTDLSEQVSVLEDFFMQGGRGNMAYADGYAFESDGALTQTIIQHNLDVNFITCDFWNLDAEGHWHPFKGQITMSNKNYCVISNDTAAKTIGAIRKPAVNGYSKALTNWDTEFTVTHNLESRFVGVTVWRTTDEDTWVMDQTEEVIELNANQIKVVAGERCRIAVVITPPTPNAFVWRSPDPATGFEPYHWLNTSYFIATVWVKPLGEEHYRIAPMYDTLSVPTNTRLKITTEEIGLVKVVLHPVGRVSNDYDQVVSMQLIEQAERLEESESKIAILEASVAELESVKPFTLTAQSAKLVHAIRHNRNTMTPIVTIWAQNDEDGSWSLTDASVRILGSNDLEVILVTPMIVRIVVSEP